MSVASDVRFEHSDEGSLYCHVSQWSEAMTGWC